MSGVKKTGTNRVGDGTPGPGRPKGIPNRATANAREAIGAFVDGNAHRLQEWLEEVYEAQGAVAALRCFADFIEYHVPKLARTEVTGKDGERLNFTAFVPLKDGTLDPHSKAN